MSHQNHETEPREVDAFVVLDLDRTLLDTDALSDVLCMLLTKHGVSEDVARAEVTYVHLQNGKSFQTEEYLVKKYSQDVIAIIKEELLELARSGALRDELLYTGSREVLDELDERGIPLGVLTYGMKEWQEYKVGLYRLLVDRDEISLPAKVTDEKYKGDWMHHYWERNDSEYGMRVPEDFTHGAEIHAKYIVVVDDKDENLESPEQAVRGIHIDNRGETAKGQRTMSEFVAQLQAGMSPSDLSAWYGNFDS